MDIKQTSGYGYDANYARVEFYASIATYVIYTLITCGFFALYWKYKQIKAVNYFLQSNEFNFGKLVLFTIITCGLYALYHQYKLAVAIVQIQRMYHKPLNDSLPVVSLIMSLVGLLIVSDCLHQHEINKLVQ